MSSRSVRIINVQQSGQGRRVVIKEQASSGGGTGQTSPVAPPFVGFNVAAAERLDTSGSYPLFVQLTDDQGNPRTHVVPITFTITVLVSSTAISNVHYTLGTQTAQIGVGQSQVELTVGITNDSLVPNDPSVVLDLSVAAVETDPQQGFESEGALTLDVRQSTFSLTIANDEASDPTELSFSPNSLSVTGLDFADQTITVLSSRAAGPQGITATLAITDTQLAAEFQRRVSVNTQVVFNEGDQQVAVPVRGLSDSPSVADPQEVFPYILTATGLSGDTVLAATANEVVVSWSQVPVGARRLRWREVESEARESPGDVVRLFVDQQQQGVDANLEASFFVQVSGTAQIGVDYELNPAPNTPLSLAGSSSSMLFAITPLNNQVLNGEDRSIVLELVALPDDYPANYVTVLEPGLSVHTCTLLADDAPNAFTVGFREPSYTYKGEQTSYDITFELSEPQNNPVDVSFEFSSPDGLTRTDIGLSLTGNTLRVPANVSTTTFSVIPGVVGSVFATGIARLVLTDVAATNGSIGVADTFAVVRVGTEDEGEPDIPALGNTTNEFVVYRDRITFNDPTQGLLTYSSSSGDDWGTFPDYEQPFDLPIVTQKYYEVWKSRNPGGVTKFDRGVPVLTRIAEDQAGTTYPDDSGLELRIGRNPQILASPALLGMEWYEGNVAQPVRDLIFYSSGTGTSRKKLRRIEVRSSEYMPYVDNVLVRGLRLVSMGTIGDQLVTVGPVWGSASFPTQGHLYIDGVAFEERLFAYNRTSAPTGNEGTFGLNLCVYAEKCSVVAVANSGRTLQVGRAFTAGISVRASNGYVYVNSFQGSYSTPRMVMLSPKLAEVIPHGYLAAINCSQPANQTLPAVKCDSLFGLVDLFNNTTNSESGSNASIELGPSAFNSLSFTAASNVYTFQYPRGQSTAKWYYFKEVRIGRLGNGSTQIGLQDTAGTGPLVRISGVETLSIGEFDLAVTGQTAFAVIGFNRVWRSFNSYRGLYGEVVENALVGGAVFNRPGGTTFDSGNGGPQNGNLMSYSGIVGSAAGYEHRQDALPGTRLFSDAPQVQSYDGSNLT